MFKAYAKVRGEEVIKYPYGFDDLQAEFDRPISGEVNFLELFNQASVDGCELVEVSRDERRTIPLPPDQQPVYSTLPIKVDGVWMIAIIGLENPPARPDDGKVYIWNIEQRQWVEIPAEHIPR